MSDHTSDMNISDDENHLGDVGMPPSDQEMEISEEDAPAPPPADGCASLGHFVMAAVILVLGPSLASILSAPKHTVPANLGPLDLGVSCTMKCGIKVYITCKVD